MSPKGFKKNINIINKHVGPDRRQDILDDIDYKGTFLPRGVGYEDMDSSFIRFVEDEMSISVDGDKIPVIFLTIQRWSEFTKTWKFTDKYKDIKMPFITIVRLPNPQVGTNQAGLWNIPGRRVYTHYKVATFEGGRRGVDLYKVPQPTSVDLNYEVRLFCNKMKDLNKLNEKVQVLFQSRQYYLNVNGHPMPLMLEDIDDESNVDDFENRRFYVQPFKMLLAGYILKEDEYIVEPSINRYLVTTELFKDVRTPLKTVIKDDINKTINYDFIFKKGSKNNLEFISEDNFKVTNLINVVNVLNVSIRVNNIIVFNGSVINLPILISNGDSVRLTITRLNDDVSSLTLFGNIY